MKPLLIGMVVFDLFLHIWSIYYGTSFVVWTYYNEFWAVYWGIFLMCLIFGVKSKR